MSLLPALLAVVAVLLAWPGPARARLERRLASRAPRARAPRAWSRVSTAAVVGVLVGPALVWAVSGPRTAVLGAAGAAALATTGRLLRARARRAAADRSRAEVAEAAETLASNLRVGMVPARALASAAATCPVLEEARDTLALGGEVVPVWSRQAERDGQAGLRDLARAWQVAGSSGASLTGTLEQVAVGLSADEALRAVVGSELAAPRASGKLMAALPALGIGMGYLIGGDPLGWLTAAPPGWACLLLGVLLACAGVLWIEALARRAGTPG